MALSLLITVTVNFALHKDNCSSNRENELWLKWERDLWPQFAAFCYDGTDAEGYSGCQHSIVIDIVRVSHSLGALALKCFTNIHICINAVSGLPAGRKLGQSSCVVWLPCRWLTWVEAAPVRHLGVPGLSVSWGRADLLHLQLGLRKEISGLFLKRNIQSST